jgi:hypothetical protein
VESVPVYSHDPVSCRLYGPAAARRVRPLHRVQ